MDWEQVSESLRLEEVEAELELDVKYTRKGEHWIPCPLPDHSGHDGDPHFSINEETFVYNCFKCGGGILPMLVKELVGFEDDIGSRDTPKTGLTAWDKAVEWLVQFSDEDSDADDTFLRQIEGYLSRSKAPARERGTATLPWFSPRVLGPYKGAGGHFWEGRGVSIATMEKFGLGFDPERTRVRAGKTYIGPAALIPHYFESKLVGWQERWLDHDTEGFPNWVPKYTNTDDFPKSETLFGWDFAIQAENPIFVFEGAPSVLRMDSLGYGATATFGSSFSERQIALLRSLPHGVILSYDNDDEGRKATKALVSALVEYTPVDVIEPGRLRPKTNLADADEALIPKLLADRTVGFLFVSRR